MSPKDRLPAAPGERLDRSRPVTFSFEGRSVQGFAGDTIASALAANGISVLSRSFKYRRPRGILSMAGHDANTLVQLADEPNALADTTPIVEGLVVKGQNYSGSLDRDRGAYIGRLGRFMPVGFYYKAFYRPKGAWRLWEPLIRRRAGLGRVNTDAGHGYYDKSYGFYAVVVVGGGPAGMAAAIAAARAGADVLLIDDNPRLGGSLDYARPDPEGLAAAARGDELRAAVAAETNIEVMTGAMCQGWYTDNWIAVTRGARLYKIRAGRVVLATGSTEQPIVFRNNDLPGVMLGSAAQRLIRLYGVKPGRRAVVATANADGYGVALDLADAGIEVAAVLDLRHDPPPSACADAVRGHGIEVRAGHTVWEALSRPGKRRVSGAVAARITGRGECRDGRETIDCDLVCLSAGYAPSAQLYCHAGGRLGYDGDSADFVLNGRPPGMFPAGSVKGAFDLEAVISEGRHAGWSAARSLKFECGPEPALVDDRGRREQNHPWPIFANPKGKEFVDFDEDLQISDIRGAVAEGYDHIELVKRYSTVGMGPSQGRHSALATARLVAEAAGREVPAVGTTMSRPPVSGAKMGQLAGRSFAPVRHTPMHHRHLEAGAQMMVAAQWLRPSYYGPADRREDCIRDEAVNVRGNVGLIDVSTLGGLDLRGPDAAEFLERLYTFAYKRQPVGRGRYVLMCDQTGAIVDDGVACRFEDQHFYVTATTGGVDGVYRNMLWWSAQWRLEVDVANVTAAFCGVNIAGPRSRQVLARICGDVDLSVEAFPYMGVRTGTVAGIPARLMRVGFVGELGYELHVPASCGEALWDALLEAGREFGIRPFGVEAQRLLRLEKGHIIVGQDTDGLTHPYEANMAWAIARKKPFHVGGRAIGIQMKRGLTRKLVGFTVADPAAPVPEECHLVIRDGTIVGRVTSAARSPALDAIIGLAYVAPDQAEPGRDFEIKVAGGRMVRAEVTPLPFYDPENKRQEL